ncbi:hypothetical protein L1987_13937 [Smallanthus sonchifolius]|uniref:Uncharacterized protein n=1 Tax=Smallanthus sonchifolius TaxID=185202 RepID=A0ACB9JK60_9ASTR|nr:hypothetical protein L1987_13937 [Smallanthus sonchifolius]
MGDQQLHLDIAYKGLEKRNNEINKLQNEILQLKCTNEKLKNSRFVVEHYESVVRQMNGLGLGTNTIPPPVSGKFVDGLVDIDLTCLDESSGKDDSSNKDDSSSKANSASNEELFTTSDDGSVNTYPKGVVSEELLSEQKVKKNIITNSDNCILTEPNIIESNDKLKVMLYRGYKNLNQVKKEAFSAHYGLGYKENLQKYYTPKNQSISGQTPVHKPTSPAHNAESSNARSNEPYIRTYTEKRTCSHYGMVGHIFVNCPSKNHGKRPIVSQPAVIPKSPQVKHPKSPKTNVVKPPVKPMVKPKITSEAKPYVSRKGKQPAIPCVSTSGSTPTGEKFVVKLSKPRRRRRNKSLRKLEQLTGVQSGEASISSPAVVEPKSTGHSKGTISNHWYVDSGCSRHMTGNMALLQDVKPFRGGYVALAGEKGGSITCQGVVSNGYVSFDNVNFCEQLKPNLLSVSQICDKEYSVMFDMNECLILKPGFEVPEDWILMRAPRTNDTYQIDMSVATTTSSVATYDCMPCKKGKQQWKSHKPKLQNSIDTPLELLHMDLFGPISIRSIGGTMDETADILQYMILSLESLCKLKVRRIRSDNGTEFKNNLMELFYLKKGIRHEFSAPYTPQQNGVAERKNITLIETARTMLSDAKLPVTFWSEAVNTACHVLNRVLVVKRHNKTCYELINNRFPNLDYLVPFGSPCSLLLHDDSSFSTRATVPIVTPDSNVASASGTLNGDNSEDVHVDGNNAQANPNTSVGNEAPDDPINIKSSSSGTQDVGELSTNLDSEIQELNVPEGRVHKNHPIDYIIGDPHAGVQTRHRTITENTSLYSEILDTVVMETCLHAVFVSQLGPKNVKEALADNCWIEAMQDELWVFKCKTDDRHVVVKNKARLEAIRLFVAYASYVGFKVYQLDVKSAFPYGKVHEEVYVTQPPGFEDPHNINKVYKLDKALYGLHQAPRAWNETLSKHLLSNGFDRGQIDSTLFIRKAGGDILLVHVYVDDIIFGSTNEGMCREFKQDILSKYKMNDSSTYGTPIPINHGMHPDKDGKDVDCRLYRGMIGSLMYLTASRPDIMFAVCLCSRLVSWQCKKQSTVSVSTCEAEYIAAASGCSQILWIQQQLRYYSLNFSGTPLFIDNNATMSITNNPVKHSKTKHIEIRHHFIRDCAEKHCKGYNHGFRSCGDLIHINVHHQLKIWISENLNKCHSYALNKYARIMARAFKSEFNLLAHTEPEWKGAALQYREIVDFLNRSRISYAISADPIVSRPRVLQFRDLSTDPTAYPDYLVDGCWRQRMGYVGARDYASYKKMWVLDQWRYFAHVMIMCISSRKAGKDAMGHDLAAAMVGLSLNRSYNFSRYVFKAINDQINTPERYRFLLYPRFVKLLIDDALPNLPATGERLQVKRVDKRVFAQFLKPGSVEPTPEYTTLFGHLINEAYVAPADWRWFSHESEPELSEQSDEQQEEEEVESVDESSESGDEEAAHDGAEGSDSEATESDSSDSDDAPSQAHQRRTTKVTLPESSSKRKKQSTSSEYEPDFDSDAAIQRQRRESVQPDVAVTSITEEVPVIVTLPVSSVLVMVTTLVLTESVTITPSITPTTIITSTIPTTTVEPISQPYNYGEFTQGFDFDTIFSSPLHNVEAS